jgi:hypothetical protein
MIFFNLIVKMLVLLAFLSLSRWAQERFQPPLHSLLKGEFPVLPEGQQSPQDALTEELLLE